MRQVPQYLIIGNGRLARHLCFYFSQLHIAYHSWHRSMPVDLLHARKATATHILLPIKDAAIDPFVEEHLRYTQAVKVHFSGALVSGQAWGAHPLMTFGPDLYPAEKYRGIPFVIDEEAPDFSELLPGLNNPHMRLPVKDKAKYHALCVMAANFSCLLWQKLFSTLESDFGIPAQTADMFLQQQTENLLTDYRSALTGPLARGDTETIERNLKALDGDPFQNIYAAFVAAYQKEKNI